MINIFPYDRQETVVDIPKETLIKELQNYIQIEGYIPIISNNKLKPFHGTSSLKTWRIILKTNDQNSFRPIVFLTMIEEGIKTRLVFEFKIHLVVRIFLIIFWTISVLIIAGNTIYHGNKELYLIPIGIIIFSFILSYMGFFVTLEKTMNALEKIFEEIKATAHKH